MQVVNGVSRAETGLDKGGEKEVDVCNSGQIMHVRGVLERSLREDSSKRAVSEYPLIEIRNVSA